jgi:putative ABC transport system substrate-binding protein
VNVARRRLLVAVGSAAAGMCAPLRGFAQQAGKMARIGILSPVARTDAVARALYTAFTDRLRELGYVEGKTLLIEWRFAEGKYDRLPLLAGELVKAQVEVIVTTGTPATSAARRATATIPIVATSFGDPVASGFAESLAHPGRNVTGFSTMGGAVYAKRIELLAEVAPGAKRIGLIVNPDNAFFLQVLPGLEAAAQKQGREIVLVNVRKAGDLAEGFATLASRRAGAVLVGDDTVLNSHGEAVAGLALKYKMATIFPTLRGAEDGGLIAYANDTRYRFQSAAVYVDRIFKGAKPGDLPIGQPMKFELAVNQKTAKALGITIPQSVLLRASRVIE